MMTVLLVIETEPDLDKQVTMPEDIFPALQTENASMAGFVPDETVTVRDLPLWCDAALRRRML